MTANQWTNDGLTQWYGAEQAERAVPSIPSVVTFGNKHQMTIDWTYDKLPAETTDTDNSGTNDGWNDGDPYIPAGSFITGAWLVVETAFAGGTSYNIGLSQKDGTVIDADGIDAAVATAALAANLAVVSDGALVGGTAQVQQNAYLKIAATGTFTAGAARLIVEYVTTGDGV